MIKPKISFKIDKKTARNVKYFSYKGKKYPFNFELFKQNSNYFYKNKHSLKNVDIISLISENDEKIIDISDEIINDFINCCEDESIDIDISNVIQLQFLSHKFEVPQLINITSTFISENSKSLAMKSLLFKIQIQNDDHFLDTSNEESIISLDLCKYIEEEEDELSNLPVPVLERIFSKFFFQFNSEKNMKKILTQNQFSEFLFACLDKHGKDASVLFSFFNFEDQSIDVVNRLLKDYSNKFDFNMINFTLLKTTSQLTSELTKLKTEFSSSLKEMKNLFEEQRNELKEISFMQKQKDEKDEIRRKEREEEFKNEVNKIKKEKEKQREEFEQKLIEMEEKQDEMFKNKAITKYLKAIREAFNTETFNQLSEESKNFIIEEISQNKTECSDDDYDDDNKTSLKSQIFTLKKFLDSIQEINKKSDSKLKSFSVHAGNLKKKIEFIRNNIGTLYINHDLTKDLFDINLLESTINDLSEHFSNTTIEVNYPSDDFLKIIDIISKIKAKNNDDDGDAFKIALFIDGDSIDDKLREKNFFYKVTFGKNITNINQNAFYQCKNLQFVEFTTSIEKICQGSFCKSLKKIQIPVSNITIGDYAFYGCSNLKQIVIPASVTTIDNGAFQGCSNLKQISIPTSVTSIGNDAFYDCSNLNKILIPSSVTSIGSNAFYNCSSLRKVTIQSQVKSIGKNAFYGCNKIDEFNCPPSIKSLIKLSEEEEEEDPFYAMINKLFE